MPLEPNDLAHLQLTSIVASADDAILSQDVSGTITSWNPAAERLFGYTEGEAIGQSIRVIVPPELYEEEDDVVRRVRAGEVVTHFETIRIHKGGRRIDVSLTVSPIMTPEGRVIGASKIARDITDRRRLEHDAQHFAAIVESCEDAIISKDLNGTIVSWNRAAERLFGYAADEIIGTSVRVIIPADRQSEEDRPDAKGVRLVAIVDPRAEAVSGDPERLQQILWNVLSNAVKFTERGGRVQVRLERVDSHVEIAVSDTGIGIPADFLPHVFDRFRQADGGISRARGGLGLGLAITRHLVELQGGRIFADSDGPGTGATFRIELPLRSTSVTGPVQQREHPLTPHGEHHIVVPQLQGIRILAVDDDPDALALLREILEATGATVTTAESGQHALDLLDGMTPDVLLADLGMPQMSGFDLIDRVRRSERPAVREIPAAALTAYARSEDRTKALRRGFQIHLAKPVDPAELMAAMAALAGRATPTE